MGILGGGNSPTLGFYFSYGKERSDKRLFHWFDLEYKRKSNFSYNSIAKSGFGSTEKFTPVTVSGKSLSTFTYRYNLAYYLINNGDEDKKILPFVSASLSYIGAGGKMKYSISPSANYISVEKRLNEDGNLGMGAGVGAGVVYRLTKKVALKATAAYYFIYSLETEDNAKVPNSIFVTIPNHPSLNIGFRWLLERDND